jgi:hypothetical protein
MGNRVFKRSYRNNGLLFLGLVFVNKRIKENSSAVKKKFRPYPDGIFHTNEKVSILKSHQKDNSKKRFPIDRNCG